jgi:hypothetical protein
MLYINTVMKAAITRLFVSGLRPAKNELACAPGITETQSFSSGTETLVEVKRVCEVAQPWMVSVS